jgi:hypothetical protein
VVAPSAAGNEREPGRNRMTIRMDGPKSAEKTNQSVYLEDASETTTDSTTV